MTSACSSENPVERKRLTNVWESKTMVVMCNSLRHGDKCRTDPASFFRASASDTRIPHITDYLVIRYRICSTSIER